VEERICFLPVGRVTVVEQVTLQLVVMTGSKGCVESQKSNAVSAATGYLYHLPTK